ncbi:DUF2834 domain-containing protein [Streptomyces sp. NPDC056835]|uniref:DUF2834 domain-containing protein n=1 Tax=Streptomyces sp. NPDC056835 TaxID=3345956 RepID=UPI00367B4DFA
MRFGDVRGQDRALCVFYGLFTLGGFAVMAGMAAGYVAGHLDGGPTGVVRDFLTEALGNLASRFIYADLTLIWLVLAGYMIVEARRHRIRHVWAYIVGAPALALCVSFPLFMLVRQLKIAAGDGPPGPPGPPGPRSAPMDTTTRGTRR